MYIFNCLFYFLTIIDVGIKILTEIFKENSELLDKLEDKYYYSVLVPHIKFLNLSKKDYEIITNIFSNQKFMAGMRLISQELEINIKTNLMLEEFYETIQEYKVAKFKESQNYDDKFIEENDDLDLFVLSVDDKNVKISDSLLSLLIDVNNDYLDRDWNIS